MYRTCALALTAIATIGMSLVVVDDAQARRWRNGGSCGNSGGFFSRHSNERGYVNHGCGSHGGYGHYESTSSCGCHGGTYYGSSRGEVVEHRSGYAPTLAGEEESSDDYGSATAPPAPPMESDDGNESARESQGREDSSESSQSRSDSQASGDTGRSQAESQSESTSDQESRGPELESAEESAQDAARRSSNQQSSNADDATDI